MRVSRCLVVAVLILGSSCKRSEERPTGDAASSERPSLPEGAGSKNAENSAPRVPRTTQFEEAMVTELLANWLFAQNSGTFSSYSESYAQKFLGIKKVGNRSFRMDRARWLSDRESMFKRKMQVQASNVEITLSGEVAVLRFEQHWASKTYEDRGPKVMTLVVENGKAKIAREELISSRVLGKHSPPGTLPIFIVHQVGKKSYAIVGDGAQTIAPVAHKVEGGFDVLGPADLSQAAEMRVWEGRQLRVFDGTGNACQTVTGLVFALARVLPHFGMQAQWEKEGTSRKERDEALFSLGNAQFAVEFPTTAPGCGEAVLAQLVADEAPDFAVEFDDRALHLAAVDAFKNELEVRELARLYAAQRVPTDKLDWMDAQTVRKSVQFYEFKETKRRLAWVSLHTGDGCGGWEGGHAMLFEIEPGEKPKFKALDFEEEGGYPLGRLSALLDVDGDGSLEYLHHSSIGSDVMLYEHHGRVALELRFSNWDCWC
jgi:hypothetical protein